MKKFLILSISLFFTLAVQALEFTVDNIKYMTITTKTASVRGYVTQSYGTLIIPANVTYNGHSYAITSIGASAFTNSSNNLYAVTIPEGVTSIGASAFNGCYYLCSVTIPSSVTSIGESAFSNCNKLLSVTIPERVSSIGASAFSGCSGLKTINCKGATPASLGTNCFSNVDYSTCLLIVPNSTSAGYSSKAGWGSFTKIMEEGTSTYDVTLQEAGTLLTAIGLDNLKKVYKLILSGPVNGTDIAIIRTKLPFLRKLDMENATIVSGGAAYYTDYVSFFTADNQIGGEMFAEMSLESVVIPLNVTSIERDAFFRCGALTSLTIPVGVTSLGDRAFSECGSLPSVIVPETVISVGNSAFLCCYSLTSINLPDGITSIGDGTFNVCYSLSSVRIPSTVTSIGSLAFNNCKSLKSISIPEGVISIGSGAFQSCGGLTSITIPASVTSIGGAFAYCDSLKEIHTLSTVPPTATNAFSDAVKGSCTLYVPQGKYFDYFMAPGWGDFANIIEESVSGKFSINVSGNDKGVIYLNETQVNNAATLVDENTAATFRFVPETGCSLTKVTQDGVDITSSIVNGSYTISSVNKDLFVIATFTEDPIYLTTKDAVSGQLKLVVKKGNQYTYKIEAESGWSINTVTFNAVDVTTQLDANKQYTTPAITGNSVLNVSYQNSGTAVSQTLASRLKVYTEGDVIVIEGAEEGLQIAICTESGASIQNFKAANEIIRVTVPQNAVYLIQAGGLTLKVAL